MPYPPELSPRKKPVQRRSREMMARIVDAGARVLAEYGYDAASTNRIAAEAGISSGSVYQYFPNKDAIVVAVLDRFADELGARIGAQIEAALGDSWQDGGRALLNAQIEVFEGHAELLRAVVEQTPHLGVTEKLSGLHRRMTDLVRMYLLVNRRQFRDDLDVDAAVWILAEISSQLAVRYVLRRPPIPRDRMINELAELVIRYIGR